MKKKSVPAQPVVDKEWEMEDMMRTMHAAHKIMMDPEKMKMVHKHAKKKIRSIKDIQRIANEKYGAQSTMKDEDGDED